MVKFSYSFQLYEHGWTEVYYRQGTDTETQVNRALELGSRRMQLTGPNTTLSWIRLQNDSTPPKTRLIPYANALLTSSAAGQTDDFPWTGVSMRMTNENGRIVPRLLRGVPDEWVSNREAMGIQDVVGGSNRFQDFVKALTTGEFGDRVLITGPPSFQKNQILQITTANGISTITFVGTNLLVKGDWALFYGMQCECGWPKHAQVIGVTTDGAAQIVAPPGAPATIRPRKAFARKEDYEVSKWTAGQVWGVAKRDTGRPLGVSRGRRSSARCCRC